MYFRCIFSVFPLYFHWNITVIIHPLVFPLYFLFIFSEFPLKCSSHSSLSCCTSLRSSFSAQTHPFTPFMANIFYIDEWPEQMKLLYIWHCFSKLFILLVQCSSNIARIFLSERPCESSFCLFREILFLCQSFQNFQHIWKTKPMLDLWMTLVWPWVNLNQIYDNSSLTKVWNFMKKRDVFQRNNMHVVKELVFSLFLNKSLVRN